jgi:photosynthetic reaction center H subunit
MGTGAITTYFDVAQLVLYMFWAFFAGLVYYLLRENHREGYPLDTDRGTQAGWPAVPSPKTYLLPNGHEIQVPGGKVEKAIVNARAVHDQAGAPLEPVGNPLTSGIGPGAWCDRADEVDLDYHGNPRIVPLRAMPEFNVSERDRDPRGVNVQGADGEVAGFVCDLWMDTSDMLFRYLEVSLRGTGRKVLLPINFSRIKADRVEVYALYAAQFADVPGHKAENNVTALEEEKIQSYYGGGLLYADAERQEPLV